jgi:plasmid stability protein
MATLTIRNLPDRVRDELRVRAAQNGRSMEAEARAVLASNFAEKPALSETEKRRRVKAIQKAMRPYAPKGNLASEELIAERRLEAHREAAEGSGIHSGTLDQANPVRRIKRGRRSGT